MRVFAEEDVCAIADADCLVAEMLPGCDAATIGTVFCIVQQALRSVLRAQRRSGQMSCGGKDEAPKSLSAAKREVAARRLGVVGPGRVLVPYTCTCALLAIVQAAEYFTGTWAPEWPLLGAADVAMLGAPVLAQAILGDSWTRGPADTRLASVTEARLLVAVLFALFYAGHFGGGASPGSAPEEFTKALFSAGTIAVAETVRVAQAAICANKASAMIFRWNRWRWPAKPSPAYQSSVFPFTPTTERPVGDIPSSMDSKVKEGALQALGAIHANLLAARADRGGLLPRQTGAFVEVRRFYETVCGLVKHRMSEWGGAPDTRRELLRLSTAHQADTFAAKLCSNGGANEPSKGDPKVQYAFLVVQSVLQLGQTEKTPRRLDPAPWSLVCALDLARCAFDALLDAGKQGGRGIVQADCDDCAAVLYWAVDHVHLVLHFFAEASGQGWTTITTEGTRVTSCEASTFIPETQLNNLFVGEDGIVPNKLRLDVRGGLWTGDYAGSGVEHLFFPLEVGIHTGTNPGVWRMEAQDANQGQTVAAYCFVYGTKNEFAGVYPAAAEEEKEAQRIAPPWELHDSTVTIVDVPTEAGIRCVKARLTAFPFAAWASVPRAGAARLRQTINTLFGKHDTRCTHMQDSYAYAERSVKDIEQRVLDRYHEDPPPKAVGRVDVPGTAFTAWVPAGAVNAKCEVHAMKMPLICTAECGKKVEISFGGDPDRMASAVQSQKGPMNRGAAQNSDVSCFSAALAHEDGCRSPGQEGVFRCFAFVFDLSDVHWALRQAQRPLARRGHESLLLSYVGQDPYLGDTVLLKNMANRHSVNKKLASSVLALSFMRALYNVTGGLGTDNLLGTVQDCAQGTGVAAAATAAAATVVGVFKEMAAAAGGDEMGAAAGGDEARQDAVLTVLTCMGVLTGSKYDAIGRRFWSFVRTFPAANRQLDAWGEKGAANPKTASALACTHRVTRAVFKFHLVLAAATALATSVTDGTLAGDPTRFIVVTVLQPMLFDFILSWLEEIVAALINAAELLDESLPDAYKFDGEDNHLRRLKTTLVWGLQIACSLALWAYTLHEIMACEQSAWAEVEQNGGKAGNPVPLAHRKLADTATPMVLGVLPAYKLLANAMACGSRFPLGVLDFPEGLTSALYSLGGFTHTEGRQTSWWWAGEPETLRALNRQVQIETTQLQEAGRATFRGSHWMHAVRGVFVGTAALGVMAGLRKGSATTPFYVFFRTVEKCAGGRKMGARWKGLEKTLTERVSHERGSDTKQLHIKLWIKQVVLEIETQDAEWECRGRTNDMIDRLAWGTHAIALGFNSMHLLATFGFARYDLLGTVMLQGFQVYGFSRMFSTLQRLGANARHLLESERGARGWGQVCMQATFSLCMLGAYGALLEGWGWDAMHDDHSGEAPEKVLEHNFQRWQTFAFAMAALKMVPEGRSLPLRQGKLALALLPGLGLLNLAVRSLETAGGSAAEFTLARAAASLAELGMFYVLCANLPTGTGERQGQAELPAQVLVRDFLREQRFGKTADSALDRLLSMQLLLNSIAREQDAALATNCMHNTVGGPITKIGDLLEIAAANKRGRGQT